MARMLLKRYRVEGVLRAETAIHVGGVSQSLTLDMPLALDGAGKPYVPGTSLAGPIRRWLERCLPERDIEAVFGFIPQKPNFSLLPERREPKVEGQASYITMDDAYLLGDAVPEIRDGVGIDRDSGTAKDQIKYDREVLPAGTRLGFAMTFEVPADFVPSADAKQTIVPPRGIDDATMRESILAAVRALRAGRIRFGAGKTRGLGRLQLEEGFAITEADLASKAGMLTRLSEGPRTSDLQAQAGEAGPEPLDGEIELALYWRAVLPVMNKSDAEGLAVDALPLVTRRGREVVPIITGASVKGVLRSHAERLCRTIASCAQAEWEQSFLKALGDEELVEALFGAPGEGREKDELYARRGTTAPGLGALAVDDCAIERPIPVEDWRALAATTAKELKTRAVREKLDGLSWAAFRPTTHVAIDRWTGGAADSLLFSRLEPDTEGERVFLLRLDLDRIAQRLDSRAAGMTIEDYRRAAVALLIVTLRDVVKGKIPVGFGVTRGLGSIEIERIVLHGTGNIAKAVALAGERTLTAADFSPQPPAATGELFATLQRSWDQYWELRGKAVAA